MSCLDSTQQQPTHRASASFVPQQQVAKTTQDTAPSPYHRSYSKCKGQSVLQRAAMDQVPGISRPCFKQMKDWNSGPCVLQSCASSPGSHTTSEAEQWEQYSMTPSREHFAEASPPYQTAKHSMKARAFTDWVSDLLEAVGTRARKLS